MITSNDIGSLVVPLILMISSYIYFITDYGKYKNYNRIFTKCIVPILVITYTIYFLLKHLYRHFTNNKLQNPYNIRVRWFCLHSRRIRFHCRP